MSMKKIVNAAKIVPLAIVSLAALGSCSKDTDLYDESASQAKAEYEENWKKQFGDIDPTQDWNGATRGSVTVNLANETTVSIYAPVSGSYRLVGKYADVNGTQQLEFDMPKGTEQVLVNTLNKSMTVKVGETVDFASLGATRAMSSYDAKGIKVEDANHDWIFSSEALDSVRQVLPEKTDNRDKVTKDFYFTSDGEPFIVYPFYWETGNTLQLGIYYLDNNGDIVRVPIYMTNDDNANQARLFFKENGEWKCAYNTKVRYYNNGNYNGPAYAISPTYSGDIKSRGIKVTLPKGLKYGMYIKNLGYKTDTYLYSESTHNSGDPYRVKGNYYQTVSGKNACYGAIYKTNGNTFLSFEDYKGAIDDTNGYDLNDLIVMITPDPTYHDVEVEEQSLTWTVACEDLGSTGDIDFNDIVFSVNYVAGSKEATVTPLAAGGVYKAEIYYGDSKLGEIHELLGATGTDGTYPFVNTQSKTATAKDIKVGVGSNFSMTNNMGGFSIKVSNDNKAVTISAPTVGACPQMFVVPGDWAWPTEYTHIEKAYPKFADWSASELTNLDWYETYDKSLVIIK